MRHTLLGVLIGCALLGGVASEAAEFVPVEPPAWARHCTRMTFITPGDLDAAIAAGVQAVHFNMVWPHYPLRRDGGGLKKEEADQLKAFVAKCHRHGIKAVLGLPPFMPVNLVQAHPEWRVFSEDSDAALKLVPREDSLGTRLGCNQGPWGNYFIELLAELVEDYQVDGYSFDGHYHPPICYAPHAKAAYRRDTGRELPAKVDLNDVAYREYLVWRGEQLEQHYAAMQKRLKGISPDIVVMSWSTNGGRYGHFITSPRVMSTRMNRLFDLPMQEWWLDEHNIGPSVLPAFGVSYLRATTGRRLSGSEPYLMSHGNPYGTDSFPLLEHQARARWVMTNGAAPPISLGWPGHREAAITLLREVATYEPWLTETTDLPWAAMLVSEQTRQFYAYRDIASIFLPPVLGWFRTAFEEHLPLSLLNDWDITPQTLAAYKVLILPGAAALSDAQVHAIREYVQNGGGLVLTGESSLCDDLGRPRGDFALANVIGASYLGRPTARIDRTGLDVNFAIGLDDSYWAKRTGSALVQWTDTPLWDDARLKEFVPYKNVRTKSPAVAVTAREPSSVAATFLVDGGTPAESLPAVITRQHGAGRVVYFANDLAAGYWSYSYPYQRRMLHRALSWAAGVTPPVAVTAPMCVQTTFYEQQTAAGKRWVIHRFNALNTTAAHGLPVSEVPLREEIVPIGGMTLTFAGSPLSAKLQPTNQPLELKRSGDNTTIALPPLELHDVIEINWGR